MGLPSVQAEELVRFPGDRYGMVYSHDRTVVFKVEWQLLKDSPLEEYRKAIACLVKDRQKG